MYLANFPSQNLPTDFTDEPDFEELTIAEIEQRIGASVPATKSRLHRARMMAREYLLS
jgi:DNA-directed RNA polymerase specialized sigma24 family protein